MAILIPYLTFRGTCEQALDFYSDCFDGQVVNMQRYLDVSASKSLAANGNHISHAEFVAPTIKFMACDRLESARSVPSTIECPVSLALQFDDLMQQELVFNTLAESAQQVILPLTKQFWGARYAEIIDQWGIQWRLNCQVNT